MLFRFELSLLVVLFVAGRALAAPCCGGSSAAPTLISSDDKAQLTLSASRSTVIGDAPDAGTPVFRAFDNSEVTETYRLDAATLLSDRFQAGISAPIVRNAIDRPTLNASASALGDVRVNLAYETLPEWTYSEWKPHSYLFLQTTLPTGKCIYETSAVGAVDATGKGAYTFTLGSLLLKSWSNWDAFVIPELHWSPTRSFDDLAVSRGFGASLALGVGMSPGGGSLRLGLRFQPIYNQSKTVRSADGEETTGSKQLVWDAGLEAGYMLSQAWSITAGYSDQTIFGPAIESTLSRAFSAGIQHRWER